MHLFKKIIVLFVISLLFLSSKDTFAAEVDYPVTGLSCYNTPKPADPKAFVEGLGIKTSISGMTLKAFYKNAEVILATNVTLHINYDIFFARHIVVYNGHGVDYAKAKEINQKTDKRYLCGIKGKRYMGFSAEGYAIVDPLAFPDDPAEPDYLKTSRFIEKPWTKNWSSSQIGTKPDPRKIKATVEAGISATEKAEFLTRPVDGFSRNVSSKYKETVNFDIKQEFTLEQVIGTFKDNNNKINSSLYSVLPNYAVIAVPPSDYSPGVFYLYTISESGRTYWYSANFIAQFIDPFKSDNIDASVSVIAKNHYARDDVFDATLTYKLTSSNAEHKMNSTCPDPTKSVNKDANTLYCRTPIDDTRIHAGLRVESVDGKWKKEIRYPIDTSKLKFELKAGETLELSLKDILESENVEIKFPKTGEYQMKVWLTYYTTNDGIRESNYTNNDMTVKFTAEGPKNVSVDIVMNPLFPAGAELEGKFNIESSFNHAKTGDLTYYIAKKSSPDTPIPLGDNGPTEKVIPFNTPSFGKDVESLIAGIKLDPGDYYLYAKITKFEDEDDYNKPDEENDNHDKFLFTVDMFIPPNTVCDFVNAPYVETSNRKNITDILDADSNKDPTDKQLGVSRTCIGYTPNYPSTVVEGGQKTFFYVAYKALAFPIPAYHVQNLDEYGVKQELTMKEPQDAVGSCSSMVNTTNEEGKTVNELFELVYDQTLATPYVALENCTVLDSFYYFPSELDDSIKTTSNNADMSHAKDWFGPYKAGAYDYYHYAYRGRLMPKLTELNIRILDPEDNVLKPQNDLGLGSLKFFFNEECYNLGKDAALPVLDLNENCRLVQLYIPGNPDEFLGNPNYFELPKDNKPFTLPEEDDRIDFLNVGLHALEVDITEEHAYLYQKDEGSEYQGKKDVFRKEFNGDEGKGPVDTTLIKTADDGSFEHIPRIVYDDPVNADLKAKYPPYMNHCYSFENANSSYGKWIKDKMEYHLDEPRLNCIHDSNSDFYYWMYKWSEVRSLDSFYLFEHKFTPTTPSSSGYNNTFE